MDTKFSTALHILVLISESEHTLSSEQIALSVGTNASHIRKITALLKKGGIIESRAGRTGFRLLISPNKLSLLKIYSALSESESIHFFDIHQNPNDECVVGKYIRPVLSDEFASLESSFSNTLESKTLKDIIDGVKKSVIENEIGNF